MGGEELHPEAVERVEAHGGDCSEDAADHEVHGGAVDEVDEEGGAATEEHGEAEEEPPAELVHVVDGPEVAGPGGDGDDEAVDEDLVARDLLNTGGHTGAVHFLLARCQGVRVSGCQGVREKSGSQGDRESGCQGVRHTWKNVANAPTCWLAKLSQT